jgi:hypothetical protein
MLLSFLVVSSVRGELGWHIRAPEILGTGHNFTGVAYGNGIFIAVADDGTVGTSTNGFNWFFQQVDALAATPSIVYGGGTFLACSGYTNILLSPDGTNWVQWPFPDHIDGVERTGLSVASNRFWLCEWSGPDVARSIWNSTTGSNWVRTAGTFYYGTGSGGAYHSIAAGGGVYVAVGTDGNAWGPFYFFTAPNIIVSADRTNWDTEITGADAPDLARERDNTWLNCVTYGEGLFVAVADNCLQYVNNTAGRVIWYSSDGTNWTYEITTLPDLSAVVYGDGVYVAVGGAQLGNTSQPSGTNWVGFPGVIVTSLDGKQWDMPQITSTNTFWSAAYGQNTFVVVGWGGQILQSDPVLTLKPTPQQNQLSIRGPIGQTCTIEATDALGEPSVWRPVRTIQLTANPMLWTDFTPTSSTNRFYRARISLQ